MLLSTLTLEYPAWYILLCLLLGAAYAVFMYFRDAVFKDPSKRLKRSLWFFGFLRFAVVSVIAFLLLSPFLKSRFTEEEKPIIVVAQDNSSSVLTTMTQDDSAKYTVALQAITDQLGSKYRVETYSFGDEMREGMDFSFADKSTNLSECLTELYGLYTNQNVGAVILASDGIYNEGSNPIYQNRRLNVPVYSIALGDTTPQKDLKISRVYHNKITYLGDRFNIKMDVQAQNCNGEQSVLRIHHLKQGGSEKVHEEAVNIDKGFYENNYSVILDANESGVQHYRVSVANVADEVTTANNVKDIFIDVLDARQKILLLADAPHPDLSAIKQAIESNKNYEVDVAFAANFQQGMKRYSVIVLHQLPSPKNHVSGLVGKMKSLKIPLLYIVGNSSMVSGFNNYQDLIRINGNTGLVNEAQAEVGDDFNLFTISDEIVAAVRKFPPVQTPFGNITVSPNAQVLMRQKIGTLSTDYPLLAFSQAGSVKNAVFLGDGLWRWRLYDFLQNGNHDITNDLISKTIQYLSVKADKRQFRTAISKNIFNEKEPVIIDAELYNDSYELVNEPDARLTVTDSEGKEFPFVFNKTSNAYSINVGVLPEGNYTFEATTTYNGNAHSSSGRFTVSPLQLEALQTTANHQLLYSLSAQNNGRLVLPQNIAEIPNYIAESGDAKPRLHDTYKTKAVINLKWIFFILLALLSLEWFLRKWNGGY